MKDLTRLRHPNTYHRDPISNVQPAQGYRARRHKQVLQLASETSLNECCLLVNLIFGLKLCGEEIETYLSVHYTTSLIHGQETFEVVLTRLKCTLQRR